MLDTITEPASAYNSLYEVFEADSKLRVSQKGSAIQSLLSIVKGHGLEKFVGVRLLHKHNLLDFDEVMAEDYFIDEEGFALITKARPVSEILTDYVPNSWIVTDRNLIPMEFSRRQLVMDPEINPSSNPSFFSEFAEQIRKSGLNNLVGPSLLGSKFIEAHKPAESSIMVESTDFDQRANILRFAPPSNDIVLDAAETHWCMVEFERDCGQVITTMACKRICPSIQNPPVHQGTFQHLQN